MNDTLLDKPAPDPDEPAHRELVRPPADPPGAGVGHVLLHVQLPASVNLDLFAGKLKARALELDERAVVYSVRQAARAPR